MAAPVAMAAVASTAGDSAAPLGFTTPRSGPAVAGEEEACRFGARCRRKDCGYRHEEVREIDLVPIVCRFGKRCKRGDCWYRHEEPRLLDRSQALGECRHGVRCMALKCPFTHPVANFAPLVDDLRSAVCARRDPHAERIDFLRKDVDVIRKALAKHPKGEDLEGIFGRLDGFDDAIGDLRSAFRGQGAQLAGGGLADAVEKLSASVASQDVRLAESSDNGRRLDRLSADLDMMREATVDKVSFDIMKNKLDGFDEVVRKLGSAAASQEQLLAAALQRCSGLEQRVDRQSEDLSKVRDEDIDGLVGGLDAVREVSRSMEAELAGLVARVDNLGSSLELVGGARQRQAGGSSDGFEADLVRLENRLCSTEIRINGLAKRVDEVVEPMSKAVSMSLRETRRKLDGFEGLQGETRRELDAQVRLHDKLSDRVADLEERHGMRFRSVDFRLAELDRGLQAQGSEVSSFGAVLDAVAERVGQAASTRENLPRDICFQFQNTGMCRYGASCRFQHCALLAAEEC